MAILTQSKLSEIITENRWAAEFFNPAYVFFPNANTSWVKIGRILDKCQYGISISMNDQGQGIPILRMNEISNCFINKAEKFALISEREFDHFKLQQNDVIFNRTNSFEFVGRTGIVKEPSDTVFASYLVRVNPDLQKILPEFLTIYLNTKFGIGQIKRRAMRSINQANVSASELKKIMIPLIDIELQKKIAVLLNRSFELQASSKALYSQATQLLEKELGLDFDSLLSSRIFSTPISKCTNERIIDSKYFQPKYTIIQDHLKTHFKVQPIKKLANVEYGYMPMQDYETNPQKGIPLIRVTNITDHLEIKTDDLKYIPKWVKIPPKKFVEKGDILIVQCGDTTGKVGYIYDNIRDHLFPSFCLSLKVFSKDIDSLFLAALLKTNVMQILFDQTVMINTVRPNTTKPKFENILVPILHPEIQKEVSNLLWESYFAKKESTTLLEQAKSEVETLIEQAANKS